MSRALDVNITNSKSLAAKNAIYKKGDVATIKNINVSRYSEDLSWPYHVINNSTYGNKTNETLTATIDSKEVVLQRFSGKNFYCLLETKYTNASLTPFKVGELYMLSMYIYADYDQWFMMRSLADSNAAAHGYKFAEAKKITRVWCIGKATSTSLLDLGLSSLVAYGNGGGASPCLVSQGHQATFDAYIGGIQIEAISDTNYKDGIAVIGDSTFAISSGGAATDVGKNFSVLSNQEITHTLGAMLNCCVYNRAVAGETLAQMDARWATDITPLFVRSKYVIIQGGINDINAGRTLEQMKSSIESMIAKSISDGFSDYILPNITPNLYCSNDSAKEALRNQYNAWLLSKYPSKCRNIAEIVADEQTPSKLRAEYYSDGIHYGGAAKYAVATYLASTNSFTFKSPSTYQKSENPFILNEWIRESTTVAVAGATTAGSTRRVIAGSGTAGDTKNAPQKFAAMGGSNVTGIVAIQASSDGGTTWYPIAQTTMTQLNGAGNYGGYAEAPIIETTMRGVLVNTSGSTQSNMVLSTKIS